MIICGLNYSNNKILIQLFQSVWLCYVGRVNRVLRVGALGTLGTAHALYSVQLCNSKRCSPGKNDTASPVRALRHTLYKK